MLGLHEQARGKLDVAAGRHRKTCLQVEGDELSGSLRPIDDTVGLAGDRRPRQLVKRSYRAEREHISISDGRDEQRFWRPQVTRPVEFGRRRRRDQRKPIARQSHVSATLGGGGHGVAVGKCLHGETLDIVKANRVPKVSIDAREPACP